MDNKRLEKWKLKTKGIFHKITYDEFWFYIDDLMKENKKLTNNWNELEEWLKEYIKKNDNWYNNELSTHDKQYYGDSYYTTNYMLKKFLDKMKQIKEGNNENK